MWLSFLLIFACVVGFTDTTITNNKMEEYAFLENYWPFSGYIAELFVPTITKCGMRCSIDSGCLSVFYDFGLGKCQLHAFVYDTTTFFMSIPGPIKYYRKNDVTVTANFTCQNTPPSPDYQTAVLQDGTLLRYRINMEQLVNQPDAQDICVGEGGRLIRILTEVKMLALASILTSCSGYDTEFWTDGSNLNAADQTDPTQWKTSLNEPLPYSPVFWSPDTPVVPTEQNCLCIYGGTELPNQWWNYGCDYLAYFICEK